MASQSSRAYTSPPVLARRGKHRGNPISHPILHPSLRAAIGRVAIQWCSTLHHPSLRGAKRRGNPETYSTGVVFSGSLHFVRDNGGGGVVCCAMMGRGCFLWVRDWVAVRPLVARNDRGGCRRAMTVEGLLFFGTMTREGYFCSAMTGEGC